MSSIRIIAVPPGFAPEYIRKMWVGVEIPLLTEEELKQNPLSLARIGTENVGGHLVWRERAVQALLNASKLEAGRYWGSLPSGALLQFKKEVCEVIE